MLRLNFFNKFFKHGQNANHKIVKYNSNRRFNVQDKITLQLREIDKEISDNSKALVEAQFVKLRSTFSKSNNFIERIGENVYKVKLKESIDWHQKQIKELYFKRKKLQIHLEKLQGVFWLNQIKRILAILLIGFFIVLGIFIFLSGFMLIVYLLPLILLIIFSYLIANKK